MPDSLSQEKLSIEQLHHAEGSRKRKHAWRLEVDRGSKVLRFFQGSKGKPIVDEQHKVPEDSNSRKLCQHHLASESIDMQVKATSLGQELAVTAASEKTLLSDDQYNEQQVKQAKHKKRKRKQRPSDPAESVICLAACPLFSLNPHKLQNDTETLAKENQIPSVVISKTAGPLVLVSPSGNNDTQQQRIQHELWGHVFQLHQNHAHQSPAHDPGTVSISLQDVHEKEKHPEGQACEKSIL